MSKHNVQICIRITPCTHREIVTASTCACVFFLLSFFSCTQRGTRSVVQHNEQTQCSDLYTHHPMHTQRNSYRVNVCMCFLSSFILLLHTKRDQECGATQ